MPIVALAWLLIATPANASTLDLGILVSSDGTYRVTAEMSQGDNLGLVGLVLELANVSTAETMAPRGTDTTGTPRGFTIVGSTHEGIGADAQYLLAQDPLTGASYIQGVGQTAGSFDFLPGSEVNVPWEFPVTMATGTWFAPHIPTLRLAPDANAIGMTGGTDAVRVDSTSWQVMFDGQPIETPVARPLGTRPPSPRPAPPSVLEATVELRVFTNGKFEVYATGDPVNSRGISGFFAELSGVDWAHIEAPWGIRSDTLSATGFVEQVAHNYGGTNVWTLFASQNLFSADPDSVLLDVGVLPGEFDALPGSGLSVPWGSPVLLFQGTWSGEMPNFVDVPTVLAFIDDSGTNVGFAEVSTTEHFFRSIVVVPEPTTGALIGILFVAAAIASRRAE